MRHVAGPSPPAPPRPPTACRPASLFRTQPARRGPTSAATTGAHHKLAELGGMLLAWFRCRIALGTWFWIPWFWIPLLRRSPERGFGCDASTHGMVRLPRTRTGAWPSWRRTWRPGPRRRRRAQGRAARLRSFARCGQGGQGGRAGKCLSSPVKRTPACLSCCTVLGWCTATRGRRQSALNGGRGGAQ